MNANASAKPIDLVRKLLAMAEGGTPAERAIALRKAHALMAEHEIKSEDLVLSEVREVRVRISNSHKPRQYCTMLVNAVTSGFGARCWLSYKRSEKYKPITEAVLVGFEPHIEVAEYVLHYLVHQLNHDAKRYNDREARLRRAQGKAALKPKTVASRMDSFAMGWVFAVLEKLPKALAQSPVKPDAAGRAVIPLDVLDEYVRAQGIEGTYKPKVVTLNEHTYRGEQAGKNVSVRAGVGGTRSVKQLH